MEALCLELSDHVSVVAKVRLGTDEEDGDTGGVMVDFGPPLGSDVIVRVRGDDGESDNEDISLGVGEGTETVVIFLTGSIPQTEVDRLSVNHDVGAVVIEHGGDVLAGEGVGGVTDEKARLTDGTVTNNDAFDVLHLILCELLMSKVVGVRRFARYDM